MYLNWSDPLIGRDNILIFENPRLLVFLTGKKVIKSIGNQIYSITVEPILGIYEDWCPVRD